MKKYLPTVSFVLVIILILVGIVRMSSPKAVYNTFAQCIKDSGAEFYGAFWCPHCREQKQLFGGSASLLPYIECSTSDASGQLQVCKDKKIEQYPTWFFASNTATTTRITEVLSLEQIAEITSCPLIKDSEVVSK